MLSGTPVRSIRKPLDDISNNSHHRILGEHVTPKKRRLENNENAEEIQFEMDPLSTGKLHNLSPKRTPAKLPSKKPQTPSNVFPHLDSNISKSDPSSSCGNEETKTDSCFGQAKKPFPTMNLPHGQQNSKSSKEQLPNPQQQKSPELESMKDTIAKSACELLSKRKNHFHDLSIQLQLLRGKYHVTQERHSDGTDESIAVYTEIPLVKEKLVYWKQKYGK